MFSRYVVDVVWRGTRNARKEVRKATQKSVACSMEIRRWSLPLCKVEWKLERARVL